MNQTFLLTTLTVLLTMLLATVTVFAETDQYTITVSAGGFDRSGSVVSFTFPDDVEAGVYLMESETDGQAVVLQVDGDNTGWFVLEDLSAGSSATYSLDTESISSSATANNGVSTAIDQNTVSLSDGSGEILSYFYRDNVLPEGIDEMYRRGGYIHPVYSPDGVPLTNHLDQELHPHHYGIFSAWTNTEFQGRTPDFWNPHNQSGRVNHGDSLETVWEGPVHGGFRAMNYFVDISGSEPVTALNEEWEVITYNTSEDSGYHMFDIVFTQTTNTAKPLILPEYHYGGMAFRGHANWDNPDNITFLTSERYNRIDGNETRARWCHMGGLVNGQRAGIAVLGHPSNYRAPQPVRIHPDTPYFVYSPMQLGQMSIEPGSPYVMRYRYITYDGEPDPAKLDRLWNDYAYPPGVTVVTK